MLGMSVRRVAMLVATTVLLGAAAGAAQAADPKATTKPLDFTVRAETTTTSIAPGSQVMKLDAAKGRWGMTINMQQPDTRQTTLNDIQAGAYYKITPKLRVGGAFAFGEQPVLPGAKPGAPDPSQPRVQLETKFKF
jgi:two component system regulator NtrZ-like protein (phosphatase activity inhibitor)